MKRFQCLLLAMLPLLLLSCGDKAKTLRPVSSRIEGPFGDYFEVVDREYNTIGNKVNVEFVRVKEGRMEPQIIAAFIDANGNEIAASEVNLSKNSDEVKFLLANKVGESSTLTFTFGNNNPTQVKFSSPTPVVEVENVEITAETEEVFEEEEVEESADSVFLEEESVLEDEQEEDEEDEEDVEDVEEGFMEEEPQVLINPAQIKGSKDWDKLLDDYESYVDQYLSLIKKANNGDLSAMTEYMRCVEKAEKLEKELDKAKGDLSVSQLSRLNKINQKMINATLEMQSWN